jgi:hypothetical protein
MKTDKWQKVIWREWRHCADVEYEEHLFKIVADEPVGWGSRLTLILLNSVAGASIAILVGFVFTLNWVILSNLLWAGAIVGAVSGILLGQRLTWRTWLARLQANTPAGDPGRLLIGGVVLVLGGTIFFGPLAWLVILGLFWSFGGMIYWLNSATEEDELYRSLDRHWWFWWRRQPHLLSVENALQQAVATSPQAASIWIEPLSRLKEEKRRRLSPADLVQHLLSNDWVERFSARYQLIMLGEVAQPVLQKIAATETSPLQSTARWLLHNFQTR